MRVNCCHNEGQCKRTRGFTLIELIVATAILLVLTTLAIPLARVTIKREKEHQLRHALWEMRDAIDRYKDAADRGAFQTKVGSENYPPDLDTLVKGVDVQGKKLKFLRKIPIDPMTNSTEWGMRSMQDDPIPTPGANKMFSTCLPNPKAPRSTGPSTRTGKWQDLAKAEAAASPSSS